MSIWNFNAGPAVLPPQVLQRMQQQLLSFQGSGLSLLEMSHRSPLYEQVHQQTMQLLREMLQLPSDFAVLLLGGGATLQFAMVPLNLLARGRKAQFYLSGIWAEKAWQDAQRLGEVELLFDGRAEGYTSLASVPPQPSPAAAYLHLTSNETIDGLQWSQWPSRDGVPVVADMSSDLASRVLPWDRFDLVYAGAQKNLGPAGVTVVLLRRELLQRCAQDLPSYLSYHSHVQQNSLYNTPPVFAVQMLQLQLQWLQEQGGVAVMERVNQRKADKIYQLIDRSHDFYVCPITPAYRSRMNVVFRLSDKKLEQEFLQQAEEEGFVGLAGHRSKGGVRASIYNAVSEEAVAALTVFMERFARRHG